MLAVNLRRGRKPPPVIISSAAKVNPSATTSITLTLPSGIIAGDMLLAMVWANTSGDNWGATAGWASGVAVNYTTGTFTFIAAYRYATASETAPLFRLKLGTSDRNTEYGGAMICIRNGVFDVAGSVGTTSGGNTSVMPSINSSGGLLIAAAGVGQASATLSEQSGAMSSVVSETAYTPSLRVFSQSVQSGETGSRTITSNKTIGAGPIGALIGIKSA